MFRKTFLINKPFQLKVLVVLGLIVIFSTNITASLTYLFLSGTIDLTSILPVSSDNIILPAIIVSQIISLIIILIIGLFFSHSMAGPIYRFEQTIENINKQDLRVNFKLRKNDEFKKLADLINGMVKKLNTEFLSFENKLVELNNAADRIEGLSEEELKNLTVEMKKLIYEMTKGMNRFNLDREN